MQIVLKMHYLANLNLLLFIYAPICLFIYLFIIQVVVVYSIFDARSEKQTASEASVEALLPEIHVPCNVLLNGVTSHAAVSVLRDYEVTSQKAGKQPSNVMISFADSTLQSFPL